MKLKNNWEAIGQYLKFARDIRGLSIDDARENPTFPKEDISNLYFYELGGKFKNIDTAYRVAEFYRVPTARIVLYSMVEAFANPFALHLEMIRKHKNHDVNQVCSELEISIDTWKRWQSGQHFPKELTIWKIAKYMAEDLPLYSIKFIGPGITVATINLLIKQSQDI